MQFQITFFFKALSERSISTHAHMPHNIKACGLRILLVKILHFQYIPIESEKSQNLKQKLKMIKK